jgi:import inner membrane translocase subunit TIM16
MVKKYLIKLLFDNGSKVLRSVLYAFRDVTKDMPKGTKNEESFTSKFGLNILSTPLTKNEALKILNLKEDQLKPELIMEQFEKYMEANDPEIGGSFYIQNKVYYAKEFLMEEFDPELNVSKYNPDSVVDEPNEKKKEEKEDITDKDKKI